MTVGILSEDVLYLCVDGGGSKSRARLLDRGGTALAAALAGPCNPSTDPDTALASLVSLWRTCCAETGRDPTDVRRVELAIGAAGLYVDAVRTAFLQACPPFARCVPMSDGYAALIGAGRGAPSGLIIAGTGVAGHRLYDDGSSIQRDAWGWVAGDRGSGAWIGQRALRHCFAAQDGVAAQDGLAAAVLAAIGGAQAVRAGWLKELGPGRLAALAPVLLDQAAAGEPAAQRIRARAVEHLAATASVLDIGDVPFYAAGGIIPPLRTLLSDAIGRSVLEPEADAVTGCWLVATGQAPEERVRPYRHAAEPAP